MALAVGLANEAFHAVAVHSMLEETLGYAYHNLAHGLVPSVGKETVMAFEGVAENPLPVAQ